MTRRVVGAIALGVALATSCQDVPAAFLCLAFDKNKLYIVLS
jgi:hypothetical protein